MLPLAIVPAQPGGADPASAITQRSGGAQEIASWVLLLAAVILLTWVFMRLQWKRQRRGEEEDPVHQMRETIADRQQEGERAAEVAGIVHELASRLEAKAARIEALIDQADDRIARLEERVAAGPRERTVSESREIGQAPPEPAEEASPDLWAEPQEKAHQPAPINGSADPLHQEVYELADAGKNPLDIARRLDQQVGTIELILALRQ